MEPSLAWIWGSDSADSRATHTLRLSLRTALILFDGLFRHRLPVHAAALTSVSLLSILPLVAVALAVIDQTGWLRPAELARWVSDSVPELGEWGGKLVDYMAGTNFRSLGAAGVLFLATTLISMLGKVERAMNEIWGVKSARMILKKALDYFLVLLATFLLVAAAVALQMVSAQLIPRGEFLRIAHSPMVANLLTVLFTSMGFTLLLKAMPNAPVPWKPALAGGIVSGTAYVLLLKLYFGLQVGMANYNLVYSSLAALPITIVWINVSWLVILLGVELSHVLAYLPAYRRQVLGKVISSEFLEETALRVTLVLAGRSAIGDTRGRNLRDLAAELRYPPHFLSDVLGRLYRTEILDRSSKDAYFLPRRNLSRFRMHDAVLAVRRLGESETVDASDVREDFVRRYMAGSDRLLDGHDLNLTLEEAAGFAVEADRSESESLKRT